MKKLVNIPFLIFIFNFGTHGLTQTDIRFSVFMNGTNLVLDQTNQLNSSHDSIQISNLKFYISNLTFWHNNRLVHVAKKKYHLIDCEFPNSLHFSEKLPKKCVYNSIHFDLGIDSLTNVSGAIGHDLDPTNGMYWTWQSGYINFKLEGYSQQCQNANQNFQFHVGGYAFPLTTCRNIQLITENKSIINIKMDLEKFFKKVDLSKTNQIMSPCQEAVNLSNILSNTFSIE